jgi:hypothetical protein
MVDSPYTSNFLIVIYLKCKNFEDVPARRSDCDKT